ncbi:MAG: SDR family oxidoreductase [Bacteroidales bacterium]
MGKTILITGATSGIGTACTEIFANSKNRLILTGRRKDRLEKIKKDLEAKDIPCKTLCFDIQNKEEVFSAIDQLPDNWKEIDILVNNAGLSLGLDPIQNGDISDWETMIDTNVKGLLYISRKISPLMIERKQGHIINIGSIAGKEVYPNGNVYCATKHAVDAITKALRADLLPYGIRVTQIAPGAVETEFSIVRFHGDKNRADQVYNGFTPLTGKDIATTVKFVADLPNHVNVNDMVVMPVAQASSQLFNKNS